MDEILRQYYEALGNNPKNYEKFNKFLNTLAEAESFSGKRQSSTKSSAKGLYHYLDESVKTSDRRINNLSKRHYIDPKVKAVIDAQMKLPVEKRSKDMQSIMVLSDLMESPKAPYSAWQQGKISDQELYYKGHHGVSKNGISSEEKVYENWSNAETRLTDMKAKKKNTKYAPGGLYQPGVQPITNFQGPQGVSLTDTQGGFTDMLGAAGAAVAPFDILGHLLGNTMDAFMPGADYNNTDSIEDFDVMAKHSKKAGERIEGMNENFNAAGDILGSVPVVGGLLKGGTKVAQMVGNLFGGGKSSPESIMGDYMSVLRPHVQAQKKETYGNAFAAMGGEFDNYLDVFTDPALKNAGVYEVGVGGTHEQNPQGGVSFGPNGQGGYNQAEEGEVVIDGPGGQKLVFTNKF